MFLEKEVYGKYICLKAVSEEDAEFTAKLRADDNLNKHIHKVDTTIDGQKKYINAQRNKDNDYYFIIWSLSGEALGTIALYNIKSGSGELGRWVSYGNALQNLESIILIHDIAFDILKLKTVFTCTNITNDRVISFWNRFGSDEKYVEEEEDFTASKNIVSENTYKTTIRPRMEKLLRY